MTGPIPPARICGFFGTPRRRPTPRGAAATSDRPLTAHGRRDAAALGKRLAAGSVDRALGRSPTSVSTDSPGPNWPSARRRSGPVQTTDLIVEALGGALPVSSYLALYGADPDLVLQYVREIDEGAQSALVVGHNPTVFNGVLAAPVRPRRPRRPLGRPERPLGPTASPPVRWPCSRWPWALGGRGGWLRVLGRAVQAAVLTDPTDVGPAGARPRTGPGCRPERARRSQCPGPLPLPAGDRRRVDPRSARPRPPVLVRPAARPPARNGDRGSGPVWRSDPAQRVRSTAASPWPPPPHRLTAAVPPPRRLSSSSEVRASRVPDMPTG